MSGIVPGNMEAGAGLTGDAGMSKILTVERLFSGYGHQEIVQDVSFSVEEGEFCALLGLNGCGKTTLIKTICGLLPAWQGRCLVEGQDCTCLNERQRAQRIAYIPQRGSLISGKTALDVVLMGYNPHLGLLESPGRAKRQHAAEVLEKLGLGDRAQRDYSELSEGQKQLVILARTLVQDTPVLLMDEPDSALDFVNRGMVLGKVRDILHTQKRAGLITLHDPNFALAYCDRLLLMKEGRIIRELPLKCVSPDAAEEALSEIYGKIRILRHPGGMVMVRA